MTDLEVQVAPQPDLAPTPSPNFPKSNFVCIDEISNCCKKMLEFFILWKELIYRHSVSLALG
jgi:hypothetical protein